MINFKDFQKTLHEDVEQLDESPIEKARQIFPSGRHGDQPGMRTRDERDRLKKMAKDINKRSKEDIVVNKGENVKEGCMKKSFREFVEELNIQESVKPGETHHIDWDGKSHVYVNKVEGNNVHLTRLNRPIQKNGSQPVRPEDKIIMSKKEFHSSKVNEELEEAKKDDYWDFKDLKDKEKNQPTSRKVAGTRYGGSAQKDEPEDDDNDDKPAVKRGRGRPAGSKSGARTAGNGKSYGGLAIHSLNLPSKK